MRRWAVGSVLAGVLLSGCSILPGGSVGANEWWLAGTSPDGAQLLVVTQFGGVVSGCTRWEDWEVTASSERVDIQARLWRRRAPGACTTEGVQRTLLLDLDEPVGSRPLTGCRHDECRTAPWPGWFGADRAHVAVHDDGVAVSDGATVTSYTSDRSQRWQAAAASSLGLWAAADVVVASNGAVTVGLDAVSGELRWTRSEYPTLVTSDVVVTCAEDERRAVDARSGEQRWATPGLCGPAASVGTTAAIVTSDVDVDGGHQLVLLDLATGQVTRQDGLDDGVDDRVTGFSGVLAVGDAFVAAGAQADLVVLDAAGDEVVRTSAARGDPIGAAHDAVVLVRHDAVSAVSATDGTLLWSRPSEMWTRCAVTHSSVLCLDGPTGDLTSLDVRTGTANWVTHVGTSGGLAAGEPSSGHVLVRTALALLDIDARTGEVQWWSAAQPAVDDQRSQGR